MQMTIYDAVTVGFMSSGANAAVAYPLYVLSSCLVHTRHKITEFSTNIPKTPIYYFILPLFPPYNFSCNNYEC